MQENLFYKKIGLRIKKFRKKAGYTQFQLSELVGCGETTISHAEIGIDRISLTMLKKIADVLNVEVYKFLTEREAETDEITLEKITNLLKYANRTELGFIYEIISNFLDLH